METHPDFLYNNSKMNQVSPKWEQERKRKRGMGIDWRQSFTKLPFLILSMMTIAERKIKSFPFLNFRVSLNYLLFSFLSLIEMIICIETVD
jgi:hypothetical protein